MNCVRWIQLGLHALLCGGTTLTGAAAEANRDEARVAPYVLPDPLVRADGSRVTTGAAWLSERRPEIRQLFERHVYGRPLPRPESQRFQVVSEDREAMDGRAVRRIVNLELGTAQGMPVLRFALFLPKSPPGPLPVFFGVHVFDTAKAWPEVAVARRGASTEPSPVSGTERSIGRSVADRILSRGYGVISMDIELLAPDSVTHYASGVLSQMGQARAGAPGPEEPGALAVWAWGLSRIVDYLEQTPEFDARRAVAIGHSRMGKAALWAAACDERIAAVISNNSGCGGAALSRRNYGETVAIITRAFPHWFCGNFSTYAGREEALPVDQHELLALIAPRPVYVASAVEDWWADPKGEYLALVHASAVYALFGKPGLSGTNLPPVDTAVGSEVRYHLRAGQHDLTDFDWGRYLDFADEVLRPGRPGVNRSE
ncbi:MAG: acetylxylan esterase [Verrucomicrobiales bacterium]|nr:acetylxylan esterase [Verrucomicrobiales bacterium]